MEDAHPVLERLERIERLERAGAGRGELLVELRLLLGEAEDWARVEGGVAGERAVAELRAALELTDDHVSVERAPAVHAS